VEELLLRLLESEEEQDRWLPTCGGKDSAREIRKILQPRGTASGRHAEKLGLVLEWRVVIESQRVRFP